MRDAGDRISCPCLVPLCTNCPPTFFHMTITQTKTYTILGEEFDIDELKDIAQYGADIGVHGFTYSSDLYDMFNKYEDEIENYLDDMGYTMHDVMIDREYDTVQQYKEWACWAYLENEAIRIIEA